MYVSIRSSKPLLIATLAMLSLRALAPDGYMPGSKDSGLIYELCPDGMPAEIMQALAGGNQHAHHHGGNGDSGSVSESCPIGHMLASAVAADSGAPPGVLPDAPEFGDTAVTVLFRAPGVAYRSRAPPA